MDPALQELLGAIDERVTRLDELLKDCPLSMVTERLHRWKAATAALLRDRTSEDVARRFTQINTVTSGRRYATVGPPGFLVEAGKSREFLQGLKQDIASDPSAVIQPARGGSPSSGAVSLGREGLFVKGQAFDAWRLLDAVLATANASIVIVDGYVGIEVLDLLSGKPKTVVAEVLTRSPAQGS